MTRIDDSKFLRGSPESRAIARALVAKTEPSPAGKALLAFLDRRTEASKEFFLAHGREPVEGDVLRLSDLEATCGLDLLDFPIYVHCPPVAEGEEATRDDGCRVKVKGGRIYRTKTAQEQKIRDYGSRACWDDVPGSDWYLLSDIRHAGVAWKGRLLASSVFALTWHGRAFPRSRSLAPSTASTAAGQPQRRK